MPWAEPLNPPHESFEDEVRRRLDAIAAQLAELRQAPAPAPQMHITVQGSALTDRELAERIRKQLIDYQRYNGTDGIK